MKPSGIHLLLTYKCNAACRHCFLNCGPDHQGVMNMSRAAKYIDEAAQAGYIDRIFIEGGEPFLYPDILAAVIERAANKGFWVGVLTNGFWATSEKKAAEILQPLIDAGLKYLGISTDAWHQEFVPLDRAERAVVTAQNLDVEVEMMVCAGGRGSTKAINKLKDDGFDVWPGRVICRGRAISSSVCRSLMNNWRQFNKCPESFGGKSRVHIGPSGEIHLCQGLLVGLSAADESILKIFTDFDPDKHPICAALRAGGPANLARFAQKYGFIPADGYTDGCQLCFEVRGFLRPRFSCLLGPKAIYEIEMDVA